VLQIVSEQRVVYLESENVLGTYQPGQLLDGFRERGPRGKGAHSDGGGHRGRQSR
jgi:hypothetical protein